MHGEKVQVAVAGQRVALNLAGVAKNEVARGDVVTAPGFLSPSFMVDAWFRLLKDAKELKNRTRIRIHHGTKEVLGRIVFFDRDGLRPGEEAFAQLRLEEPIVPRYRDRIVARSYSPIITIGGGQIIDSHPIKHRRSDKRLFENLRIRLEGTDEEITRLSLSGMGFASFADVSRKAEISDAALERALSFLKEKGEVVVFKQDKWYFALAAEASEKEDAIARRVSSFHKENPLERGITKQRLRAELFPKMDEREFDIHLSRLSSTGRIALKGALVSDPKASVSIGEEDAALLDRIERLLASAGFSPPEVSELQAELSVDGKRMTGLLEHLAAQGKAARISHEFYFDAKAVEEAKRILKERFAGREISVSEFRQLLGTSRKYALPLLNYFDAIGLTRRHGDARILR